MQVYYAKPTLGGNFGYIIIPRYIHNETSTITLVAIATVFKMNSLQKYCFFLKHANKLTKKCVHIPPLCCQYVLFMLTYKMKEIEVYLHN